MLEETNKLLDKKINEHDIIMEGVRGFNIDDVKKIVDQGKMEVYNELAETKAYFFETQEQVRQMNFLINQFEESQNKERDLMKTSLIDYIMVVKAQFRQ